MPRKRTCGGQGAAEQHVGAGTGARGGTWLKSLASAPLFSSILFQLRAHLVEAALTMPQMLPRRAFRPFCWGVFWASG